MNKTLLTLLSVFCITAFVNSQTTFGAKTLINATDDQPFTIASGLIDGDTYNDILIASYGANHEIEWYKNNGDGTFTAQTLVTNTLSGIGGIKLVDLNNDTFLDILATSYNNDIVAWYENDGTGNFNTAGEVIISSTVDGASGLAVGTIDAGATIDVVVTAYDGNSVVWFSNDGSGVFTGPNMLDNTLTAPGVVNLKDIDGDTDLDALVLTGQYNNMNVIEIFRNDGTGVFTKDATSVSTGEDYLFNGNFVDYDGDANLDILVTELDFVPGAGSFLWFEDNGAGFTRTVLTTSIGNPSVAQMKDLDDDGLNDIVLSNGNLADATDIVWFKNNGAGSFGAEQIISNTQGQPYVFTVVDLDNDNDLDIVSCDYNADQLNWFENEKYTLSNQIFQSDIIGFYPNPAKDKLYFRSNSLETLNVSVYDVLGKRVITSDLSINKALNISKLKSGLYIIKFEGINKSYKFVKEN